MELLQSYEEQHGPTMPRPAQALTTPSGSVAIELVRRFRKEMATANAKQYVTDLTKDEACAICFFAEVPYSLDGDSITFHACGLQKRNGVWTAFTSPNVEHDHPACEFDFPGMLSENRAANMG